MSVCGTDYLSKDIYNRSYVFCYALACYFSPLLVICYCYWFIVSAVSSHEKAMREQAKKMNVASLRSAENQNTSAECKLAKVRFLLCRQPAQQIYRAISLACAAHSARGILTALYNNDFVCFRLL